MSHAPTLMVVAGGTGGHVFPGLAVAQHLQALGWQVTWVGGAMGMEAKRVPQYGLPIDCIHFGGLRGKDWKTKLLLPFRLAKACWQSARILARVKPDVVLGMGGYIAFPVGMMAAMMGYPLVLHEQNATAGWVNRLLAKVARRVLVAFPGALPNAEYIGNPIRQTFTTMSPPKIRYASRCGPLKLLVVGGSLGASALNEIVPQALALLPLEQRPSVIHQSGEKHIEALYAHYRAAGLLTEGEKNNKNEMLVENESEQKVKQVNKASGELQYESEKSDIASGAEKGAEKNLKEPTITLVPFIEDMAKAYAQADIVICRSGAMTVAEVAAIGVAALFVPYPHAVDDHQMTNAAFLSEHGAAHVIRQHDLCAQTLADWIMSHSRQTLKDMAVRARERALPHATQRVAEICESLIHSGRGASNI